MLPFGRKWWLLGLLTLLVAGCQQVTAPHPEDNRTLPETTPQQKQLATSLEAWNALKAEKGDYYRYQVSAGSAFGPSYDTTLTVQKGEIVQRDLTVTEIDDEGNVTVVESWSETGAALGSHNEGAELITIDARYSRCRDEVLSQDPTTNTIYLTFQANGVLKECSYIPENVVSDGGGEVITDLEFAPFKND